MESKISLEKINYDWIGNIPSDWELKKFKFIFKEKKSTKNPLLNSGSISFGEVIYKNDEKIAESTKNSYQEVLNGEFLINPLNLNFDLKSLRIGLSRIDVVVSQGYIVLKINKEFFPNYYKYLLRKFDIEHMKSLGQGVRQTISFNDIKDEYLVVPPYTEQKLISQYLDKKTSQIDLLIKKIEKKIELLKEQKTALINQYVSRGLNPNIEMIDSGIDWIGKIPKTWKISKIKYQVIVNNGSTPKSDNQLYWGNEIKWFTPSDFKNKDDAGYLWNSDRNISVKGLSSCGCSLIEQPSLLLTTRAPVGNLSRMKVKFTFNQGCKSLTPKGINIDYLYYFLITKDKFLNVISNGTTFKELSTNSLLNLKILLPSNSEQEKIVYELNKISIKYEKLISLLKNKILILEEYHQSLISSVVTGKIRITEDMI